MRVAMVSEHASPLAVIGGVDAGGQNVHVAALATELGRRGVGVIVHTRRDDPATPRRVALAPNVTVDHVDAGPARPVPKDELTGYMPAFAADLVRQWQHDRPDVVHAHFWMSGRAALAAAGQLDLPVIETFHALGAVKRRHQGDRDTSPLERLVEEQHIIARADHVIATCSDEVFELVRLGGDASRISVVPCGVDLAVFTPDGCRARRKPGWHRVLVVGRLVERKGIADVVTALACLPRTELLIAGGPPVGGLGQDREARRLMALAQSVGVADRVQLLGQLSRTELAPLLRSADLVVSVPWYEPFGIVPLEAMACGVPVVASAVGGMLDTVVDGVTGVHVPARNPVKLASAMSKLLADPATRATLGAAGVARARSKYSWPRAAEQTLTVYRSVANTDLTRAGMLS